MREENIQIVLVENYFRIIQQKQTERYWDSTIFVMPRIPKDANQETKIVLHAYQNMVRVWDHAGGSAPDPMKYLGLLLTMGCNHLVFNRCSTAKQRD